MLEPRSSSPKKSHSRVSGSRVQGARGYSEIGSKQQDARPSNALGPCQHPCLRRKRFSPCIHRYGSPQIYCRKGSMITALPKADARSNTRLVSSQSGCTLHGPLLGKSHSLNGLMGVIKRDTRSLDYGLQGFDTSPARSRT